MASKNSKKKKTVNIRQYKTKQEMNVGILLFAIVFIYLIVTVFMYATDKKISVYEVREGSIVKDNSYTGLILREEMVVNADSSGYIYYFQNANTKMKNGNRAYVLAQEKLDTSATPETETTALTSEEQKNMLLQIQNFNENYDPQKFSPVYSMKQELDMTVQSASNQSKTAQLGNIISQNTGAAVYPSVRDGIISLTVDGYEGKTEADLLKKDFDRTQYERTILGDEKKIQAGEPAYKLITSENWQVYVELDKTTAKELRETTAVKTRIDKDNETMWADFSILEKDGTFFGRLDFYDSMIRYADERYLNIELILEDQSGLKIPKSALVEKPFYTVPKEYLTSSGNSSSQGVMVKKGDDAVYQQVTVYYTTEDGDVYLNPDDFEKNPILVKPEGTETPEFYTLKNQRTLKGVYNINRGYAIFKQIHILCENDDYYIVEEGTPYGLSNYDHIVQDAKTVKENEVVFQ